MATSRRCVHCRWWRLQQALFYVDDAHGVGVVGDGRGAVAAAGLGVDDVPLQLVTLGKALGGSGALVLGRDDLIDTWPKPHARTSTPLRCHRRWPPLHWKRCAWRAVTTGAVRNWPT
jgi:hypothetical protein